MKVLFLCTANSCRSILCEAVFSHLAPAGMKAYNAGSLGLGSLFQGLPASADASISHRGTCLRSKS